MSRQPFGVPIAVMIALLGSAPLVRAADHLFVTTSNHTSGNCAALAIESPWSAMTGLEPVGAATTVRHFHGLHWVVNGAPFNGPSPDEVQAIDPLSFETVRRFSVGPGSNPRDIVLADPAHAWVSRYDSRWLLEIDAISGAPLDSVDLGGFADADGLPEMAWMALDGTHLFVQIQRIDRSSSSTSAFPGLLAVVDVVTRELIDVDPGAPGVQAVELLGPDPQTKMKIEGRRLYVSTPGGLLDVRGGIEEIDLDSFENLGFLISESDWSIDMGAFILVSPTRGYSVNHTDFALSSHLQAFARPSGTFIAEYFVTFGWVDNLAYDSSTDQLFFPDPGGGVRVFRGATGEALGGPIATGQPPRDLVLFRGGTTDAQSSAKPLSLTAEPNPFRQQTRVAWSALGGAPPTVTIHDVSGRLVRGLVPTSGALSGVIWDGRDDTGRPVAAGVYIIRAKSPWSDTVQTVSVTRLH